MDSRLRGNDEENAKRWFSAFSGVVGDLRGLTDSHLRGDYAPWRDLFVDVANGGFGHDDGDSGERAFRHFYQQAQMRLFSSLDNALAAKASDAFYHYDSVKSARVQFQTALGGRKANLGIDVIGSIMEQTGDNVKHAIGWQAHVFAGENTSKGISGGIFYRHLQNQMLHGVNLFADYEQHEHGDFYRYGIGGEVRHEYVAFAANYYIPLTDDIRINNTEVAYSREGYDANLQVAIPGARYLKAEAAFYHFDGRHDNAADKGFRYGAALSPSDGVLLKLFYDNGGEEFGGALSWRYNFHPAQEGPQVHHDTPRMSSADLFAPVLREHSQRIAIATVIAGFPLFGIVARNVEHQQISPVATLYIPQGYFAGLPSLRAAVSLGGEDESSMRPTSVSFSDVSLPNITVIYHSGESFIGDANPVEIILQGTVGGVLTATSFFMTIAHYRTFAASFAAPPVLSHATINLTGTVGTIRPSGGIAPYSLRSSRDDVSIDDNGLVLFDNNGEVKTITAVLTADDSLPQTVHITLILAALDYMTADVISGSRSTAFIASNNVLFLASVSVSGGHLTDGGDYDFNLSRSDFIVVGSGPLRELRYGNDRAETVTATLVVDDDGAHTAPVSFFFTVSILAPLAANRMMASTPDNRGFFLTANANQVWGMLTASGGSGGYSWTRSSGDSAANINNAGQVGFNHGTHGRHQYVFELSDSGPGSDLTPNLQVSLMIPVASRLAASASVAFTIRTDFSQGRYQVSRSAPDNWRIPVLLPPDFGDRPIAVTVMNRDLTQDAARRNAEILNSQAGGIITESNWSAFPVGNRITWAGGLRTYTMTIQIGSEILF